MTTLFQAEGFMPPKENNSNFFDHSSSPNVVITSIEATPKVNAQDINDPLHLKNANEAFISNNPINSMAEENDNHDLQDYQNSSNIYTFEHNDLYKKLVFPTYTQDSGIIKECYHHHGIDEDHECAQIESPGEKKMPNTPITGLQYCLTSQFRVPETFHNSKTDEALQFELDNPSRSTSFAASTSSNNNLNADGTLSSVDSNSAFNENNNSTSIIHKNAALTLSNSDNNSSGVGFTLSSSNILKCTPPSSLVSRINVEVIKNENPPLQQIETFKQPNTLFNPFVYSAIGSLENINQNISASFKQKIFDASAKTSHGVTISVSSHQHLNKREKKILKDKSNKHKGMSSNRNTSNPRHLKDGKGEITDTNIKPSQSLSLIEEKMEHTSTDTRRDSTEICQVKASKHQSGRSSKRRNIKNKKVNINLEATQVVKPVELFRPSCDAYTPRMEKKDIKFKPAETRTSVKEMSTSMGSIQRPNFRDALRRVAMILLKHIVKIERRFEVGVPGLDSADLFNPAMRDAFDEDCFVTPRYKCSVVKMPMSRPGLVYGMRKIKKDTESQQQKKFTTLVIAFLRESNFLQSVLLFV
eukprot:CAMPEP_0184865726 /NCGR_PEP_ID=MMETSP0580-20130426/18820_1 /TAXON_ID=1118495 /ORGANISM="Dactyliosolen fragilissimus" /LENGTH=584 /DNA_ID=CAMNT_0027365025 /DNA_START=389 /DNA_END=2144 /DNA_ORIENTATION=-